MPELEVKPEHAEDPNTRRVGLLVGVVVSMSSLFAPEMAKVSIFALMAIVLIIRPQGFFGRAGLMS